MKEFGALYRPWWMKSEKDLDLDTVAQLTTDRDPQPRGISGTSIFGALDPSPNLSRSTMPVFKKSKKSRRPSQQPASLGIPTHIAAGPLGFGATLDLNVDPEGAFRSIEIQQPMGLIRFPRQVQTMEEALE